MITLPHHCEFLSDEWLAEANVFLGDYLTQARRPDGARTNELSGAFAVSERFTDAPPHLGLKDDVAAWTLRFDGTHATMTRAFDSNADIVVNGDYQAALMLAQTVGARDHAAMAAAFREMRHLFGDDAVRMTGTLADTAAQNLAADLHDHLARRTVENPDIAHRSARQGVADKVREMHAQGYTVLERAITPEFADEVRAATLRALTSHGADSMQWMLYHGPALEQLVQNPMLMTLIDASLGRGAVIASISAIRRGAGPGSIPMHNDYSMVPEPYPDFAMTGVGVWALEDWTVESGPTWLVPGSHKLRRAPKPGEARPEGVPIEMPKGSVVYFTHGVWHWQGDRSEPGERVTIHSHFNRGILRSLEPKRVDVHIMHRNPPRLGEMLGEDDWFDKLTAAGRDHRRARYMSRLQAFTDERQQTMVTDAE